MTAVTSLVVATRFVRKKANNPGNVDIVYQLIIRYSEDKMKQALITMGKSRNEYDKSYGGSFIDFWHQASTQEEEWALQVEEARHTIKYYYRDIAMLHQTKCLDYETVKLLCQAGGVYLFVDCVIPMERKKNPYAYAGEYYPIPQIVEELRATIKPMNNIS